MDGLEGVVREALLAEMRGSRWLLRVGSVVAGVSNRHVHLSREHLESLFGRGYELRRLRDLRQPGQFACEEKVLLASPFGVLEGVRVLGPLREETQVELSPSDARRLGVEIPLVRSGSRVELSSPLVLVGPKGSVEVRRGVGVAWRHVHLSPQEASEMGLRDGDEVCAEVAGDRGVLFRRVWVRVSPSFVGEFHVDVDEANACGLKTGDRVDLLVERVIG